jgi:phosphodiesterase/alkaline phosphatase D-like protein
MSGASIVVKTSKTAYVRLAYSVNSDLSSPAYVAAHTVNRLARFDLTGLSANTQYYYGAEVDGVLDAAIGSFKTLGAATLKICAGGDAASASAADSFSDILAEAPDIFFHLGDLHYQDIATDEPLKYHSAFDVALASATQGPLYQNVPTVYVWDDHDYCGNNTFGTAINRKSACRAYRRRVPHLPLEETADDGAIYHSFEVDVDGIGVVFLITDLRSRASDKAATDNSSKTMLGTTQKTWFKGQLSSVLNDGKLFVWICSRVWGGVTTAGADHWGGFNTERTELADHIQTEASGRILVLSADMHSLAIDDGTNHDFTTTGSEPIPTFQCAPLDQTGFETYGGATYSEGQFTNNGQFGIIEFSKTGASQITVDLTGKRDTGATLVTHQLIFNL